MRTIYHGRTGLRYTLPLYFNFVLRLTTTNPLLPVCLNNRELSFIVYTGILHNVHLCLGG